MFFLDAALLAIAVYLGFALRLSVLITPAFLPDLGKMTLLFPFWVLLSCTIGGVYKVHWPQASVEEYARLARSYVFGASAFLCNYLLMSSFIIPRTSLAISLLTGIILMGGIRASWRLCELSGESQERKAQARKRALIIGAGEAGAFLARDLARRTGELQPVGFLDEDTNKRGKDIAGLPVLGDSNDLEKISAEQRVQVALIALPSASGARVRSYLEPLSRLGIEVRVLPSMRELAGGRIEVGALRNVQLADLLRREAIELDTAQIGKTIRGKRVLVTGAGGSIGSEICTQLLVHEPSQLILLGHGEQSLYLLEKRLRELKTKTPFHLVVSDIAERVSTERLFRTHVPEIVFHAAAHKHVPLMEENPREALRVNSYGSWLLANAAGEHGCERFVMISSDKAVHPSSIMGATKRIAERLIQSSQQIHRDTRYMAVRFGNVLGSRGSVVPLFEEQIRNGGPVTVTHRDMMRYFMLIPEAVSLVLQAGAMGKGGELFVLDMGKPINITEMAETLIRLHGLEPYRDVEITFTGIRPGEKLYEELFYDPDHVDGTMHDKIFLAHLGQENTGLEGRVVDLMNPDRNDDIVREGIFSLIIE